MKVYTKGENRLWPLAPPLLPNEAISSWLDRCASAYGMDRYDVVNATADAHRLPKSAIDIDWDLAPDTRMLAILERSSGLAPGSLLARRLPHATGVLRPSARKSYCPLCYAAHMRRDVVPPTPVDWHLSFVTQCRVHKLPFFPWPDNLSNRDGARFFSRGVDWEARPGTRRFELRIGHSIFSVSGKTMMKNLHLARALYNGELRPSEVTQQLWRRQGAFQEMMLSHWWGRHFQPHRVLGSGLQVISAVSDMASLIISPFGSLRDWPRILDLQQMLWDTDLAYFARWLPTIPGMSKIGPESNRYIEDEPSSARRSMALGLLESIVEAIGSAPPIDNAMESRRHRARLEVLPEAMELLPDETRERFRQSAKSWSENLRFALDIPVSRTLACWPRGQIMALKGERCSERSNSIELRKKRFVKNIQEKLGKGGVRPPNSPPPQVTRRRPAKKKSSKVPFVFNWGLNPSEKSG